MQNNSLVVNIEDSTLEGLLSRARNSLLKRGIKAKSQRGLTWSLNRVILTWTRPTEKSKRYFYRFKKADEWYQNNFVRKRKANLPEKLAKKGDWLFPYKYAHRSRYYDAGWGYVLAVVRASEKVSTSFRKAIREFPAFKEWFLGLTDYVHIQNALAVLNWLGKTHFIFWQKNVDKLENLVLKIRVDTLERITQEIKNSPLTRRAITPSFLYPTDYCLDPMMGIPPYQNFQLLPAKQNSALSSLHWHRSLDVAGGAQLDFNHDFDWLKYACLRTGRKMGSISIMAGNIHLYTASNSKTSKQAVSGDKIQDWLSFVTDGYRSGQGIPVKLMDQDRHKKNVERAYFSLTK